MRAKIHPVEMRVSGNENKEVVRWVQLPLLLCRKADPSLCGARGNFRPEAATGAWFIRAASFVALAA
jgi:hypothetical protein